MSIKQFIGFGVYAIIFSGLVIISLAQCKSNYNNENIPIKELIYIPIKDSISEQSNIARIISLEYKLKLTQDSLYTVKDSIGEELVIARIKLERIKEYNRIAAKGNNIKYLRGWINRVLND